MDPQSPERSQNYKMPFGEALKAIATLEANIEERATNTTPGLESNLRDAWANFIPTFGMWAQMACIEYSKSNNPEDVKELGDEIQALIDRFKNLREVDVELDAELKQSVSSIKAKIEPLAR